ncbi:MAG: tripartite tricarboxylate transporter TctB family protein [Synergistaceae bacterium]|jgi:hypothetical protein|nr:tripartite tricarboxylate transporter TctB family protein [Synergistaceae bacterium]
MLFRFGEIGISVLSVLAGIAFGLGSRNFPASAGGGDLGPAFFPGILSLILIILGSLQCLFSLRYNRSDKRIPLKTLFRVIVGMGLCTFYIYMIPVCGYFYVTIAFCPLFLLYQGYRKIPWIVGISVGFVILAYGVFYRMLAVALPL